MPGPAPPPIKLTSRQQHLLEKLLRASSTEQRLAQRAEIILTINQSRANNQHVARCLRLCRQTVGKWRTRWADAAEALAAAEDNDEDDKTLLLYIEATLADAARSGPTSAPKRSSRSWRWPVKTRSSPSVRSRIGRRASWPMKPSNGAL